MHRAPERDDGNAVEAETELSHDAEQKYDAITLWRHLREDGFHLHEIIPQNLQKHQHKHELHLLKMTLPNLTKTNHDKEEKLDQGV